jgi:hypothetical protein
MMEISAAHDILGDEEKRREYDETGGVGGAQQQHHRRQQQHGHGFDPFSQFFAHRDAHHHFPGEDAAASASTSLISENYDHLVSQDPHNVWIIQFISRFCHGCKAMAAAWEQAVADSAGLVRMGRIHYDNQQSLVRRFTLRTIPTIIAVHRGAQATLAFGGNLEDLTPAHILEFGGTMLPANVRSFAESLDFIHSFAISFLLISFVLPTHD